MIGSLVKHKKIMEEYYYGNSVEHIPIYESIQTSLYELKILIEGLESIGYKFIAHNNFGIIIQKL